MEDRGQSLYKGLKPVCSDTTFQDGKDPHFEGDCETERLHGQSRPKGWLLHSTNPQLSQTVPQVQISGTGLSVQLPPLWSLVGSISLYQDFQTNRSTAMGDGDASDSIHKRYPGND